jgi:hypothetical protein
MSCFHVANEWVGEWLLRRTDNTMAKIKPRSTKHTHKTKDRVTRTPLKTGGELMWYGSVSSSCSTSGTGYPFGIFKLCLRFLSQDEVRFVALINGIILAIKSLLNFVFNVLFSRCEWVSRWMIVVYAVIGNEVWWGFCHSR